MEWAVGKGYDLYRPNTGKLLLPGSQISWDVHIHAVGEEIRDHVELGVWLYPKGQEPKYRTYLTGFQALRGFQNSADSQTRAGRNIDIPPNSVVETNNYTVLKQAAHPGEFPAAHAPARQGHGGGSDSAGRDARRWSATSAISTSIG